MAATQHASGDVVFLETGEEVEFVARLPEGVVVRPIYEGDDDEPRHGRPYTINAVFAEPPVAKLHDECARLAEEAAASRAKIAEARREWAVFEREEKERQKRVNRHGTLQVLDDFLSDRITHVVVQGYGPPEIKTFPEFIAYRNDRGRDEGLKLLTLFGRSGGHLTWGVNHYSDGSGSNSTCVPTASLEEAQALVATITAAAMESFREKAGYMHGFNYWVDAASRLGITLPADLSIRWFKYAAEAADQAVTKAEADTVAQREHAEKMRAALAEVIAKAEATP